MGTHYVQTWLNHHIHTQPARQKDGANVHTAVIIFGRHVAVVRSSTATTGAAQRRGDNAMIRAEWWDLIKWTFTTGEGWMALFVALAILGVVFDETGRGKR